MPRKKSTRDPDNIGLGYTWMLVDRTSLRVSPRAEEVLRDLTGRTPGNMTWSAGVAAHLLHLAPAPSSAWNHAVTLQVAMEVRNLMQALAERQLALLPTGAHPFMDPRKETLIWKVEQTIWLDRAIGSDAHGWGNSHRTTLELPFSSDEAFTKLHTALRMVIPILPALAASSPWLQGERCGMLDGALMSHLAQGERMPALVGQFVPPSIIGQEEYYRVVLEPIALGMAALEAPHSLDHQALNRHAIVARFDRNSVLVQVADQQECVAADAAIAEITVAVTRAMVEGRWVSNYLQRAWHESDLAAIMKETMRSGGDAVIANKDYLLMFGLLREQATAAELWRHLYQHFRHALTEPSRLRIAHILDHGCLAKRMVQRLQQDSRPDALLSVYRELIACLEQDKQFK